MYGHRNNATQLLSAKGKVKELSSVFGAFACEFISVELLCLYVLLSRYVHLIVYDMILTAHV